MQAHGRSEGSTHAPSAADALCGLPLRPLGRAAQGVGKFTSDLPISVHWGWLREGREMQASCLFCRDSEKSWQPRVLGCIGLRRGLLFKPVYTTSPTQTDDRSCIYHQPHSDRRPQLFQGKSTPLQEPKSTSQQRKISTNGSKDAPQPPLRNNPNGAPLRVPRTAWPLRKEVH
jgi:hypothetical protein